MSCIHAVVECYCLQHLATCGNLMEMDNLNSNCIGLSIMCLIWDQINTGSSESNFHNVWHNFIVLMLSSVSDNKFEFRYWPWKQLFYWVWTNQNLSYFLWWIIMPGFPEMCTVKLSWWILISMSQYLSLLFISGYLAKQ